MSPEIKLHIIFWGSRIQSDRLWKLRYDKEVVAVTELKKCGDLGENPINGLWCQYIRVKIKKYFLVVKILRHQIYRFHEFEHNNIFKYICLQTAAATHCSPNKRISKKIRWRNDVCIYNLLAEKRRENNNKWYLYVINCNK